jgi:chromosome segregation ATPase
MSNKTKRDSPLIKSVLALDTYLTDLERVGTRINSTDMASDVDVEYTQKLMTRFAECIHGVSGEVTNLSTQLHEARARAEAIAQGVARQAESFNSRRNEMNEQLERFRLLGEKVRELNAAIGRDRAGLQSNGPALEGQLAVLIEELKQLREAARNSRMKTLEKNAESLAQTLQAVHKKLRDAL